MSTGPDELPLFKLLRSVQAQPRTARQSVALAVVFTLEVFLTGGLLDLGYTWYHAGGLNWAVVSAVLVLQPGLEQSITTALVRIGANFAGALAGLLIGSFFGIHAAQVFLAIVIVIFFCELLRLDLGLRSACVSVIIVMTTGDGRVIDSARERFIAVLCGCTLALLLQLVVETVLSRLGWLPRLGPAVAAMPKQPHEKSAHIE